MRHLSKVANFNHSKPYYKHVPLNKIHEGLEVVVLNIHVPVKHDGNSTLNSTVSMARPLGQRTVERLARGGEWKISPQAEYVSQLQCLGKGQFLQLTKTRVHNLTALTRTAS